MIFERKVRLMFKKITILSVALFSLALMFACGGGSQSTGAYTMPQATREINKANQELNRQLIEETFATTASVDYKIGPGDLLAIQVLEAPDLNTEARVTSQNSISFPLLGNVNVAGLTPQQAEQRIAEMLTEQYMHNPHIIVSVKEYKSQRVAVIGSVKNPGTYELLGKGTLLDALALAGGLELNASDTVYVTRKTSDGGEKSVQVDLDELLDKGDTSLNIPINMGDVVYVPEAGVFYVDGAVVKPGSYPITGNITVSQAVTAAGGMDKTAKASDVRLLRNRGGQVEVLPVNLDAIKEGQMPDMVIQDQDVVVVGKSAIKSFFDAIKLGLFFPPFSMGVQ